MKRATILLAIIAAAFVVGCHNGDDIVNVSNQIAPSLSKSLDETSHRPTCRRVEIHGHVRVPGQFNAILEVNGTAEYAITLLPRDPIPPNPEYTLVLEIVLSAELTEIESGTIWFANGSSLDEMGYNDGDEMSITKRYWIANLSRGMWLNVQFRVTKEEIEATALWLQLPKLVQDDEQN
jgi:hypothetical protein